MAIATATLDFDSYGKLMRPAVPADAPVLEALRECPRLANLPEEATRGLMRDASLRSVGRGTNVAPQGGRLDAAIVVVRGRVRAVCRAVNGREISMEIFRPGDLIADGALAPEAPLAHDWEAIEASTLLFINRDAFLECVRATPELALALGADLVARLERSKQLATGLALAGVQERVVSRLVALGRQDGTAGPDGLLIRNRPTQQELANQIGACRETVSRTVSELVRQGLLTPRGRSLLVSKRLVDAAV
ncbi:MAG TPA: Crp/Fnr family transcriptional regulator [Polyangia bacterium]|nr:Crp/Fnr family transcriptional regulator [Polyangia bacterium]